MAESSNAKGFGCIALVALGMIVIYWGIPLMLLSMLACWVLA